MKTYFIALFMSLIVTNAFADTAVHKVIVFTNHNHTIEVSKTMFDKGLVTIHNVDEFVDAETELNKLLEEQALKQTTPSVYARMNEKQLMALYQKAYHKLVSKPQYAYVISSLQSSSLSLTKLLAYDIKALPAIVINDRVVIYGHSNVGDAVERFLANSGEMKK